MRATDAFDLTAMIDDIERLVACESPSDDLAAVARSADVVADVGAHRLGREPERIVLAGRSHLRWRFGDGPQVLVVGHHDTVWPTGSLIDHPFEVSDGILRGPGCVDMKGGLVMAFHALAALDDLTGVTVLVTGDEELGAPSSRALVEDEGRASRAALVLEAAADGGALKTERKGLSMYEVRVRGRAAHAGLAPETGVNASVEAASQLLAVAAIGDAVAGTTVTPTVVHAGSTTNTVPATARFAVDVRVPDTGEQRRVDAAIRALRPRLDGAKVDILGGPNRGPLEAAASRQLFRRARELAEDLGLSPLAAAAVGGVSDGNLTAAVGTPTLDGLGAVGGGAHAPDEHVVVDELPDRTRLLAALVADLQGEVARSG